MKNEPGCRPSRIVELLSESLKRQDQMVEEIRGMSQRMERIENATLALGDRMEGVENATLALGNRMERVETGILSVVSSVNALTDLVKVALDRTKKIDSLDDRVKRLENTPD